MARRDREEPMLVPSKTDMDEPRRPMPHTDSLEPKFEKLRSETVEPMWTKSRTDIDDPLRAMPNRDSLEPKLP